jgi:hypothetical protein
LKLGPVPTAAALTGRGLLNMRARVEARAKMARDMNFMAGFLI